MSAMTRRLRGQASDESGAVTVEFSLLLPIALLFIGFLTALGLRTLWAALADDASRSLARYASIRSTSTGYYPNRPLLATKSDKLLGGILGTPTITMTQTQYATLTYNQDATDTSALGPGDLVTVKVSYRVPGISFMTDLVKNIPLIGMDLSGFSTVTDSATARRE